MFLNYFPVPHTTSVSDLDLLFLAHLNCCRQNQCDNLDSGNIVNIVSMLSVPRVHSGVHSSVGSIYK